MLNELEYHPILIDAHQKYLRSLYGPPPAGLPAPPSRREALGRLLVRFGLWLEQRQPEGTVRRAQPVGSA